MDIRSDDPTVLDRIRDATALAFAVAALVTSIALIVIPFGVESQFSAFIIGGGWPVWARIGNVLSIFASAATIAVGIALLRRGARLVATGIFIALAVALGLRTASEVIGLLFGGVWTLRNLAYELVAALEVALLLLAASRARREESAAAS